MIGVSRYSKAFALTDVEQAGDPTEQQVGGLSQKHAVGRVDDIGRCEPEVHPFTPDVDRFGEEVDKCGDIVVGDRLSFLPRLDRHLGSGA